MAVILQFRTSTYSRNIILYGSERLTARDGFVGVADGYYTPVEKDIATKTVTNPLLISRNKVDIALQNGWINQQEYDEIIALIPTPTAEQQMKMDEVAKMETEAI